MQRKFNSAAGKFQKKIIGGNHELFDPKTFFKKTWFKIQLKLGLALFKKPNNYPTICKQWELEERPDTLEKYKLFRESVMWFWW